METVKQCYNFFWQEKFWFPRPFNWNSLKSDSPDIYYPQFRDIFIPSICLAFVLLLIRYVFERLIVTPIGIYFGVKIRSKNAPIADPFLEDLYSKSKNPDDKKIREITKKSRYTHKQIQHWLRKRRLQDLPCTMQKFRECSWHFLFYTSVTIYGLVILWDKSWFWETKNCWIGFPKQHVSPEVYWYYLIELSFYWSLVFTLVIDHKRKDFLEMVIHHIVTMMLMYFSWACNFVRVGTLVLLVHDASDYWMALAKMAKYCKKQTLCEGLFILFVVSWIITRLGFYPFRVVYSTMFEVFDYLEPFPAYYLFNVMLCILQVLHLIWTYMIARIALQKFTHGEVKQDVRSDTETETGTDEDVPTLVGQGDHLVKNGTYKRNEEVKFRGHSRPNA